MALARRELDTIQTHALLGKMVFSVFVVRGCGADHSASWHRKRRGFEQRHGMVFLVFVVRGGGADHSAS